MREKKIFSAPTVVNLEITDVCNVKCRHCYNFWREDSSKSSSLTKEKMDLLIEQFVDAGVFHVVLTGGEPFARFDLLEYGFKKLVDNNISISCNSNLMLATDDKIRRLRDAGLDHILTSLNSYDRATNDYMVHQDGAFDKIVSGIESCIKNDMRVSVNMIVSERNKMHVYDTALFAHSLGCQKIFGTRVVPSINECNPNASEFKVTREDALSTVDQLIAAKEKTGIMIGTLVSYPLCLLSDLEKYRDFVGRGCPAQSGHILSLNADGNTHACVHQEEAYGNIFEDGIYKCYEKMHAWHDMSYRYPGCMGCDYIDICQTGCRMSAHAFSGDLNGQDNFMTGKDSFVRPYKIVHDPMIYRAIENNAKFTAPKRLRFRKENGFYLVNIRWANTVTVPNEVGEFLQKYSISGELFSLSEFGAERKEMLAQLFFKDAIESDDIKYDDLRSMSGLSSDLTV
ncbi:MAG: radical SAM/SPASM domain-containing protein [Campylobacterales bacterium]